jgi:hypothetical protein
MGLFGLYTRTEVDNITKLAYKQNEEKRKNAIIDDIIFKNLDRAKADIEKWRNAILDWENWITPDRYEMMQLYAEIEQDDAVKTHLTTVLKRIGGTVFEVGKINGEQFEIDQEKTDLLSSDWFFSIVKHIIESEMKGFAIVEVFPDTDGDGRDCDDVQLIPRQLIVPEWHRIKLRPQATTEMIDYTLPEFIDHILLLGDKTDKGLYNNIAPLYIYKKNALSFWANYQAKFGIPPVIVKTDLTNKVKTESLKSFLEQMRSNTFGLVGYDDEVEILQTSSSSDIYQTYLELIEYTNGQIAKIIEGQTMTSSNGSSRSQAEVHERTAEIFHLDRLRMIERVVNKQLFPILTRQGDSFDGYVFRYKEMKDVDEVVDRVVKLSQAGFTLDANELGTIVGLNLQVKQEPAPEPINPIPEPTKEGKKQEPTSMIKQIDELYSKYDNAK